LNPKLLSLFNNLEWQRNSLLNEIKSVSKEKLNAHPPGKWSTNQVLAHIITAEQLSIGYVKKKFQGINDASDTGLLEELKMVTLYISQRLPLKFKAPKVVVESTPVFESIEQIEAAWNKARADLKELLNQFNDTQLSRKIYKHPAAGRLNIQQTLKFFGEHIIHHQPQIKKLLKQK
jgi:uncharacterized damage-inducible protein DinB